VHNKALNDYTRNARASEMNLIVATARQIADSNGIVILSFCNYSFIDLAVNLVMSIERVGRLTNLLLIALDERTQTFFRRFVRFTACCCEC
jgi:hypothetical protein